MASNGHQKPMNQPHSTSQCVDVKHLTSRAAIPSSIESTFAIAPWPSKHTGLPQTVHTSIRYLPVAVDQVEHLFLLCRDGVVELVTDRRCFCRCDDGPFRSIQPCQSIERSPSNPSATISCAYASDGRGGREQASPRGLLCPVSELCSRSCTPSQYVC